MNSCERSCEITGPVHDTFSIAQQTEIPDWPYRSSPGLKPIDQVQEQRLERWEGSLRVETPAEVKANFASNRV